MKIRNYLLRIKTIDRKNLWFSGGYIDKNT